MTRLMAGKADSAQMKAYYLMSRTPARFTQPDIARTIRAAKQAGAGAVELLPDGTIRISLITPTDKTDTRLEPEQEIVL